jgi:hypothetical protein
MGDTGLGAMGTTPLGDNAMGIAGNAMGDAALGIWGNAIGDAGLGDAALGIAGNAIGDAGLGDAALGIWGNAIGDAGLEGTGIAGMGELSEVTILAWWRLTISLTREHPGMEIWRKFAIEVIM